MQVTVEYSAQVKRAAGVATETFELDDGTTLCQLVSRIAEIRGEALAGTLFNADGELHPSILVFVNDVQILTTENPPLSHHACVTFLSPISGG